MTELESQNDQLVRSLVRGLGSVVVAYSGGVDSSVVLAVAREELGPGGVLAVTATSEMYPDEELEQARVLAERLGVRHLVLETDELERADFRANPPDRCYYCKLELFGRLVEIARQEGFAAVADGVNRDDQLDFRPGMAASDELGVRHPLLEAGLSKEAVRSLALRLGLESWSKPAMACLSSRIPYGEEITREKLARVRSAERYLNEQGFEGLRVRHHGHLARIEVPAGQLTRMMEEQLREPVVRRFKELGFTYVTLDLEGFRSGSMNEVLERGEERRA